MKSFCSFLCLPKETNQRKGSLCPLSRRWRDALCSSMLPGLCKLGFASNSANPLFGSLSGARRRANGISLLLPFVLPRLADGGGKRRGNCLRAKPEFFSVPPSSRSKGSPQGQDWLGCLFLVSSFGHAKEEKPFPPHLRTYRKPIKKGRPRRASLFSTSFFFDRR